MEDNPQLIKDLENVGNSNNMLHNTSNKIDDSMDEESKENNNFSNS